MKLHIRESKIYTQITITPIVSILYPQKRPLKTPTLKPYEHILLFCLTIRELWTLAAPDLLLAGS